MNLLVDTRVLLWWLDDPAQLSEAAGAAIRDGANVVFVVHPTKACATDDCNARLCNRRSTGASPLFGYFRSFKSPV